MPAIIPFSGEIPPESKTVAVDHNSFYPESGVRYAGHYKVRSTTDSEWELRKQTPFVHVISDSFGAAHVFTTTPTFITQYVLSDFGVPPSGSGGFFISDPTDTVGNQPWLNGSFVGEDAGIFRHKRFNLAFRAGCPNGFFLSATLSSTQILTLYGWEEI